VDAVELHEVSRDLECFFLRADFHQRVSANDFLGLRERAVGDVQLSVLAADPESLRRALEPGGLLENPALALPKKMVKK